MSIPNDSKHTFMFTAYVDESGITDSDDYVFVGGFIAPDTVWDEFNVEWQARLKESGLTYMHMAEFKADKPPFCPPMLNRAAHQSLEYDLSGLIQKFPLEGLVVRVQIATWRHYIQGMREVMFGDSLQYAFQRSGSEFHHIVETLYKKAGPFALRYGESHLAPRLEKFIKHYTRFREQYPEIMSGVSFDVMKHTPGIQAADMLVWEVQDHTKRSVQPGSKIETSKTLERLGVRARPIHIDIDEILDVYHSVVLPSETRERLRRRGVID